MATIFNESTVAGEPAGKGATRQHLLTQARVPGTGILLDRLTLGRGGEARLTVPATSVAWFQVLDGEALLTHGTIRETLSDAHVAFLPPGFSGDAELGPRRCAAVRGNSRCVAFRSGFCKKPAVVPARRLDARTGA